ncbi:MAG: hypothetical protein JWO38_4242 [Gemmataceae bacterium]|nr:hypothetical protein [Gemmataceae bacterium]
MRRSRLAPAAALIALVCAVSARTPTAAVARQEPAKPAAPDGPVPVPEGPAVADALKLIRDVYKADYAKKKPAEQVELGRKLLKAGAETKDDPAARFVMYKEARDLAVRGGDVGLALDAAAATARAFAVDPVETKYAALDAAEKSAAVPHKAVVEAALDAADGALQADEYATAARFLRVAAGRAKLAGVSLVVAARHKELEDVRKGYEATEADRKTLKTNPAAAAAAGRVGRFLCLLKGDWDAGLPLLAKCEDEKLKVAAERDLARPIAAADRVELGDRWWDLVEGLEPAERAEARVRAFLWYQQAAPDLSGLPKARVDKRLGELAKTIGNRVGRVGGGGWRVIFRSADPGIWNTDTAKGQDHCAATLARVPADVRYLRLKDTETGKAVIVEMTKSRLGDRTEQSGYGWNGTNANEFNARHLGIYDLAWGSNTSGPIAIYTLRSVADYRGWGFGHAAGPGDRQAYTWGGEPAAKTVFEIAVKTTPLTPEEAGLLLKKKK